MASVPPKLPAPAIMPSLTQLLLPGRVAGTIVLPCGKISPGSVLTTAGGTGVVGPGLVAEKKLPCDVASIGLTVERSNAASFLSVNNSAKIASAAPLAGVPADVNKLLAEHAVVVYCEGPAAAVGSMPTATQAISDAAREEIAGKVILASRMKSACGDHPLVFNSKWKEGNSEPRIFARLGISTTGWEIKDILNCAWGDGKFSDLWASQRDSCTFTVTSCGKPAGGDPLTMLSAHVVLAQSDEWVADLRLPSGFVVDFTHSTSTTLLAGKNSERIQKTESKLQTQNDEKPVTIGTTEYLRGNSVQYRTDAQTEKPYDPGKHGKSLEADSARYEAAEGKALEERLASGSASRGERAADTFKKRADGLADALNRSGSGLSLKRNGKEMLDASALLETVSDISNFLKTLNLILYRLIWLAENGLCFGAPVSGKFDFALLIRLMQGSVGFRVWPEQSQVHQSGAYYVSACEHRWQLAMAATPFFIDMTIKGSITARFLHDWLASVTGSLEFKVTGSGRHEANWSSADGLTTKPFTSTARASIKATVEGSMASFYLKGEGEVTGAIVHTMTITADSEGVGRVHNLVDNGPVSMRLTGRRGNKILDFFSLKSDDDPNDWKWPENEPLVLLERGALKSEW